MLVKYWMLLIILLFDVLGGNIPRAAEAFTLDGYFKILAMAVRKRDLWRKIFLGNDVGFEASPWIFKDREVPPYVPIVKSFPKYPMEGHYRDERKISYSSPQFPQYYSNLQLSHRLPPPPGYYRPRGSRYLKGRPPTSNRGHQRLQNGPLRRNYKTRGIRPPRRYL